MPNESENARTIKVKYFKSQIGQRKKHRLTLRALGLRKLNQVVELPDTPQIRGMIAKIPHLVRIVED